MESAVMTAYGSTDVLEIAEMPRPQLQPEEVLVSVHSAGINPKEHFYSERTFQMVYRETVSNAFHYAPEIGSAQELYTDYGFVQPQVGAANIIIG